jgi:predicted phosphodiesterase
MSQSISPVFKIELNNHSQEALFTVWSDSQGGWENFSKILVQMKKQKPQFTVGIGDLVGNGGNYWHYIKLLNELHQLPIPHYLFPGNHDYDGSYNDWVPKNFKHYLKTNSEANYRFWKSGPCVFVGLDPNENFPVDIKKGSDQYNWFKEIIQSEIWKKTPWKIILVHQPPFSQGWKGYHGEKNIQDLLKPYWESGMIDLVISGHTHDYERLLLGHQKGKTGFLIVGGAGGSLEPENEMEDFPLMDRVIRKHHFGKITADHQKLVFEAHSIDGVIIDKFTLEK